LGASIMPINIFNNFDDPSGIGTTHAIGVNDAGQIVGWYENAGTHGFVLSGGVYTPLDDSSVGTAATVPLGIHSSGQIVVWFDASRDHGFLLSRGIYTTLDDPSVGTTRTHASGINSSGQIVGTFFDGSGNHGFLYSGGTNGTYTTLNVTGGFNTEAFGIND